MEATQTTINSRTMRVDKKLFNPLSFRVVFTAINIQNTIELYNECLCISLHANLTQ